MTEAIATQLEIVVGDSKYSRRGVSVWVSETADSAPKKIRPAKRKPLTFVVQLPAAEFIVADHRAGTEADSRSGRKFPVTYLGKIMQVEGAELRKDRTHVLPIALASRSLELTLRQAG